MVMRRLVIAGVGTVFLVLALLAWLRAGDSGDERCRRRRMARADRRFKPTEIRARLIQFEYPGRRVCILVGRSDRVPAIRRHHDMN
jgi:hypothetical protein